jgi:hypothetical protein
VYLADITVSDGRGNFITFLVTINVIDVPESPVYRGPNRFSRPETTLAGTVVANGTCNSVPCIARRLCQGGFCSKLPAPRVRCDCAAVSSQDDDTSHGDQITHQLVPELDHALFRLDPASGLLTTLVSFNFEVKSLYNLTVRVEDTQGFSISYRVLVVVENLNEVGVRLGCFCDLGRTGAIIHCVAVGAVSPGMCL